MVSTSRIQVTYALGLVTGVRTGDVAHLQLITKAPGSWLDTNAINQVDLHVAQTTIREVLRPGETQVSQPSVCAGVAVLQITS